MSAESQRLRNHVASYKYSSPHRENCLTVCDELDAAKKLLADIKSDLDERAEMNDWAKVEDPELFFSTLGHTEDDGFVVALGATNYWRLSGAVTDGQA